MVKASRIVSVSLITLLAAGQFVSAQTWQGFGEPVFYHSPRAMSLGGAHALPLISPSVISANPALVSFSYPNSFEYVYSYQLLRVEDLPTTESVRETAREERTSFFGTFKSRGGKRQNIFNALNIGIGRYPVYDYHFDAKDAGNEWKHSGGIYSHDCVLSLMKRYLALGMTFSYYQGEMVDNDLLPELWQLNVKATGYGGALGLALRHELKKRLVGWLSLAASAPAFLQLERTELSAAGGERKEYGEVMMPARFRASFSLQSRNKYLLAASYLYVPFSQIMSDGDDLLRLAQQRLNDVRAYGLGFELIEGTHSFRTGVSRRNDFRRWFDAQHGESSPNYYVYSGGWGYRGTRTRSRDSETAYKLDVGFSYSRRGEADRHLEVKVEYRGMVSLVYVL